MRRKKERKVGGGPEGGSGNSTIPQKTKAPSPEKSTVKFNLNIYIYSLFIE